jgi:lysophospholipase L1-like esterase
MNKHKNLTFRENRLIFLHTEVPTPAAPESKPETALQLAKKTLKQGYLELRQKVTAEVKTKLLTELPDKPTSPPAPDLKKATLPEISAKLSGLKIDKDKPPIKNPNGTLEQHFQFGDQKIQGKIIIPPKSAPDTKTTYLFNYVDKPDKFDHSKFLADLKKHQKDLGNTVIITLKTPEGETKIDGKTVATMQQLTADLEQFQNNLKKDPKYANWQLPRAEKILHMTSPGEKEKVTALLNKYGEATAGKDTRVALGKYIIDSNDFPASLERALTTQSPAKNTNPEKSTSAISTPTSQPSTQSSSPATHSHGPSSAPLQTINPTPSASPETSPKPLESFIKPPEKTAPQPSPDLLRESPKGLNKLLALGDSLMTGVQGRLKANEYTKLDQQAVGGWSTGQILNKFKEIEKSGGLEKYRNESLVMNGGVNDLANGQNADQILNNMKKIWEIAAKFNIKVYCCTIMPFKGAEGYRHSLSTNYEQKEGYRNKVNQELLSLAGTKDGPYKIIPLHKPYSEGGLADENDTSKLHPAYAGGDKLHLTGKGYNQMTKAIQDIIGLPSNSPEAPSKPTKFSYGPAEVKAADRHLAEILHSSDPKSHIGERTPLGDNMELVVAWHKNHEGQWGTDSYKELPGVHIGVQIEPARKHPADSAEA